MELKVLICEEEEKFIIQAVEFINSLLSYGFHQPQIEVRSTRDESLEAIANNDYDLFIVDVKMPNFINGDLNDYAGLEILSKIADKYYGNNNKIRVPIFQYTQYPEDFSNSLIDLIHKYPNALCKHLPFKTVRQRFVNENMSILFESLEQVQKNRILRLHKTQQEKLKTALQSNNLQETITINGESNFITEFLFPKVDYNSKVYLSVEKIANEFFQFSPGPINGIFNEKSKAKGENALKLKNEIIRIYTSKDYLRKVKDQSDIWFNQILQVFNGEVINETIFSNWKITDPFCNEAIKYSRTKEYIEKIVIWRWTTIQLFKNPNIRSNLKININSLGWVYMKGKNDGSVPDDYAKKFFTTLLGFSTKEGFVLMDNLFPLEEKFYLQL